MWTEENQRLLCQGFLKMNDGTLISWKPPSPTCKIVELTKGMGNLIIEPKVAGEKNIMYGLESDIVDAIHEWCSVNGGDPEKLIAECGFKRSNKIRR